MPVENHEGRPANPSFKDQLRQLKTFEVGGRTVGYHELKPEDSRAVVVFFPGFVESKNNIAQLLEQCYRDGIHVLFPIDPRPSLEAAGALIQKAANESPDGKTSVWGRSAGGVTATKAASKNMGHVDSLYVIDTAGIASPVKDLAEIPVTAFELMRHPSRIPHIAAGVKNAASHPWDSTRRLIDAHADIRDDLAQLKTSGIHVTGIAGGDDSLFPQRNVQRKIAEKGGIGSLFHEYHVIPGKDHWSIFHDRGYQAAVVERAQRPAEAPKSKQFGRNRTRRAA